MIIEAYFSPNGGTEAAIVSKIDAAKESIFIITNRLTAVPVADALAERARRDVVVECVLHPSAVAERFTEVDYLKASGVSILLDEDRAVSGLHFMVIDSQVVVTSSNGFTGAADTLASGSCLVVEQSPVLLKKYARKYLANSGTASTLPLDHVLSPIGDRQPSELLSLEDARITQECIAASPVD